MISQYVFIFVLSINYCEREFPQISHHCILYEKHVRITFGLSLLFRYTIYTPERPTLFLCPKSVTNRTAVVLTISLFTTISNWPSHNGEAYASNPPLLPHIFVPMQYAYIIARSPTFKPRLSPWSTTLWTTLPEGRVVFQVPTRKIFVSRIIYYRGLTVRFSTSCPPAGDQFLTSYSELF